MNLNRALPRTNFLVIDVRDAVPYDTTYCTAQGHSHSQLENEFPKVALGPLLRHDIAHLLAHGSDLRRLRVARLLDLVVLLLSEADARLGTKTHAHKQNIQRVKQR